MTSLRWGRMALQVAGAALLLFGAHHSVGAQERFPTRPIELVIAFPAGGVTDLWGRVLAEEMGKLLRVPILPINKGGASGTLGAIAVLNAPRDGYTLVANTLAGMVLGPTVLKDVAYDAARDFVPVALIASMPDALIVRADSSYKTMGDLIDAARRSPGRISYASVGAGSVGHFNGEILAGGNDIKIKHVPFKGGGEVVPALMGGHVEFSLVAPTACLPLVQAGKLRVLAVTGTLRLKALAETPTFAELGVKGTFIENWAGCFVAAGTPTPIVDVLVNAAEKVVTSKEFMERIEKTGGVVQYVPPGEFRSLIERDRHIATAIAKRVGIYQRAQ